MNRSTLLVVLISTNSAIAALPSNAIIRDLISGPTGTLYAAGAIDRSGFIAQLPDGYFYRTTAPVSALAVSADGSVFATGTATADNFPFTFPTTAPADYHAFILKLGPTGKLQYARFVDGVTSSGLAIAVNSAGEALVSGFLRTGDEKIAADFPTTPGAVTLKTVFSFGFIVKLDASGRNTLASISGYGGGPVAFDAAGNMYVTGQLELNSLLPTAGAFEPDHVSLGCGGTSFFSAPCPYEYVAKLNPDGTKLLYSTYLTGQYGSTASALFVDSAGNAIVTGTTNSHDFPVTPSAFQLQNRGADGPSIIYGYSGGRPPIIPPPTAGVISKINPDGTALLWSTYFGGSGFETITSAQLDLSGNIVFTGLTGSADLPGATPQPVGCSPSYLRPRPYVAKLNADGTSVLGATYLDLVQPNPPRLALATDGSFFLGTGATLTNTPITTSNSPAACIVDAADLITVSRIAPNQLLTIFTNLGTTTPQVTFNGVAADILYSGPNQINVRVPNRLTGSSVTVALDTISGPLTRTLALVTAAPSAFVAITPVPFGCNGGPSYPLAIQAVTRNADGTANSCTQPAVSGSVITLFLNGLGDTVSPIVSLQTPTNYVTILSADPDPDSPGVWRVRVQIQLPPSTFNPQPYGISLSLLVNGEPVRDNLAIHAVQVIG